MALTKREESSGLVSSSCVKNFMNSVVSEPEGGETNWVGDVLRGVSCCSVET